MIVQLWRRGVVLATAHVRGGGEHGRGWHVAAIVERKWASLYDYAAALRHLVERGITGKGLFATEAFSAGVTPVTVRRESVCAYFDSALVFA
jgi:protease II